MATYEITTIVPPPQQQPQQQQQQQYEELDTADPVKILPESFTSNVIWRKKTLNECIVENHSPAMAYNSIYGLNVFGPLNEMEYSANFQSTLPPPSYTDNYCYSIIRYYYKQSHDLYINDANATKVLISNNYLPDARKVQADSILRIDFDANSGGTLSHVTAKLKLFKDKFNIDNTKVTYTGAIEVPVPELHNVIKASQCYSRKRIITYWYLRMKHCNSTYRMRIAFRRDVDQPQQQQQHYECNVECEDLINGARFMECFDLIYKYYKTMAKYYNAIIPMYRGLQEPQDLTPEQRKTLRTFKVIAEPSASSQQPLPQTEELVKFLSVLSYNSFNDDDDNSLYPKCIFKFNHSAMCELPNNQVDSHNIDDDCTGFEE